VNVFAAMDLATGETVRWFSGRKTRADFLRSLDGVADGIPADKPVHVVMDNLSTHKNCEEWLEKRPRLHVPLHPGHGKPPEPDRARIPGVDT
jgi:hypothetical protein